MNPHRPGSPPPDERPDPGAQRAHHIHLSRRSFLAGAGAIVATGAAAAVFGCEERDTGAPSVAGTSSTPRTTPVPTPNPERGGTLRVYNQDAMPYDSLDPHQTAMGPIVNLHAAIFSRLLRYRDEFTGDIVPDLAAGMPEQPDETTYVFRIRDGVRFHDELAFRRAFPATSGRLLTADDVRLSIERQLNLGSPRATRFFRRGNFSVIERIEVPDASTLIIRTREPVSPMLSFLAGRHAFIVPREVVDQQDEILRPDALIGTGPFVLDSFEERIAVRLKRNDRWFAIRDAGGNTLRPYLDAYHAYFQPGEDAFARAAFDRRIVDVSGFNDSSEVGRAHSTNLSDIVLEEADGGAIVAARLLLDRAPFQDPRAREAIHLALDRSALLEAMMPPSNGMPSARLSAPVAPGAATWALDPERLAMRPGYRSDQAGRADDVAEAAALWRAAMGTEAVDLRITFAGLPEMVPERAIHLIQQQLQGALGANVITSVDTSGHALIASAYTRNLEGATEGALTFTFGVEDGGIDLDDWLYPHFRSGEALNTYRLQDPQLDSLLDAQRREFDVDARRQLGFDAQEYLLANVHARLEIFAPIERRLAWGYVRAHETPLWYGSAQNLADTWLDASHPAYAGRLSEI